MSHAPGPGVVHRLTAAPGPLPAASQRRGPASLATSLALPAASTAPGCARATLRDTLAQWGLDHLTDPAEAITSELVANAVTASSRTASNSAAPGDATPAPVTLWITVHLAELRIRVWDPDPVPPPRD